MYDFKDYRHFLLLNFVYLQKMFADFQSAEIHFAEANLSASSFQS